MSFAAARSAPCGSDELDDVAIVVDIERVELRDDQDVGEIPHRMKGLQEDRVYQDGRVDTCERLVPVGEGRICGHPPGADDHDTRGDGPFEQGDCVSEVC